MLILLLPNGRKIGRDRMPRNSGNLISAAKKAEQFISELLGVDLLIPGTPPANEAQKIVNALSAALAAEKPRPAVP